MTEEEILRRYNRLDPKDRTKEEWDRMCAASQRIGDKEMSSKPLAMIVAHNMNLPTLVHRSISDPDFVAKVMAFHHFYKVPMSPLGNTDNSFNHMTNERVALRLGFQIEELKEAFKKGFGIDLIVNYQVQDSLQSDKDYEKFQFPESQMLQALNRAEHEGYRRNGKEVADAAADSTYFWIGFLLECGYDLRSVFAEVHAANMTKPDENGEPIYREDGKVLKGPNYVEPNIAAALGMENAA